MARASFDRDSFKFVARRVDRGIQINAEFHAPESQEAPYSVSLIIDPVTRLVRAADWLVRPEQQDQLIELEKLVRDEVLRYPAWNILRNKEPDPNHVVDGEGHTVFPDLPRGKRIRWRRK